MAVVFCKPQQVTYQTSSTLTVAEPKNLSNDEPGMVWRSSGLSGVYVVFKTEGKPIDTIALIGNNLRATDTIRIRMGSSVADVNGVPAFDQTYPAWQGIAPIKDAISFVLLDSPVTQNYIRIDFTSPGNPAGYVEVCRLLIGTRVEYDGFDIGREETIDDTSGIDDQYGAVTIEEYRIRQQFKFSVSNIKDADYYEKWQPFLMSVGTSKFFLLLEEVGGNYEQRKAFYVRNTAQPKRADVAYNNQSIEFTAVTYK